MSKISSLRIIAIEIVVLLLCACRSANEINKSWDASDNVDALYKIISEKYCYLDEKNCDWDAVYSQYSQLAENLTVTSYSDQIKLFDLLSSMLDSLRDGHVNLYSSFDVSRSTAWYDGYPVNFNSAVVNNYLQGARQAGGLMYNLIHGDTIGYIYYNSFANTVSDAHLAWIVRQFSECRGIVLDVRNNGGGDLTNAEKLAGPFFRESRIVGYWQHKTGAGRNDFSKLEPKYIEKNELIQWQRPVVVLTNRRSYSATNYFACAMKEADNCALIGGITGGGGGMPMSYELPCGWTLRFSSIKMTDKNKNSIENGVTPDLLMETTSTTQDEIIEKAVYLINKAYDKGN